MPLPYAHHTGRDPSPPPLPLRVLRLCHRRGRQVRPNEATYTALIGACVRGQRFDRAEQLFQEMGREGARRGVGTYNAVMYARHKAGRYDEAVALLSQVREAEAPSASALL